jgi:hypothetical protein
VSGIISRVPASLVTSIALALAALILTSFFGAGPTPGTDADGTVRFDAPASRPWCGPADEPGATSCRYSTFEQCLAAASADYRTCKPNPAAVVIHDDAPYWTYRSVFL